MAFSAGFSPHPKISYTGAAPTGVASEAEYLELGVTEPCDPGRLRADLDASLPKGIDVLEVVEARTPGFAERLEASLWELRLPAADAASARIAVERFLAAEIVEVERLTKKGIRRFDAREAVLRLEETDRTAAQVPGQSCVILRMVVRHVIPAVRPDDVLAGLRHVADFAPPISPEVIRLAQGPLDAAGEPADPFDLDRDATRGGDTEPVGSTAATGQHPPGAAT